jgi:hypothetical protein
MLKIKIDCVALIRKVLHSQPFKLDFSVLTLLKMKGQLNLTDQLFGSVLI